MSKTVKGFSKFTKEEKIDWLASNFFTDEIEGKRVLGQYLNEDEELQKLHDEFIENTISNFYIPYAIAPNFVINGRAYAIPMAIEASSVVAAASLSSWNSDLDEDQATKQLCLHLFNVLVGGG